MINQYGIVSAYRIGGTATIFVTLYFVVSQWFVNKFDNGSNPSDRDEVELREPSENSKAPNEPKDDVEKLETSH